MVRGKTILKKIENESSRLVTFSKRRGGLFKKAKELAILCDAQVAVLIFSSTGQLYDFSSCSMKSIIERYRQVKEGQQNVTASREAKYWQGEAESLRQQLHNLEENHRHLLGQHLSGLSMRDLQTLENQLETSLTNIRLAKERIMIDLIQELNKKSSLIDIENKELHHKICAISQENANLKKEVHGQPDAIEENTGSVTQYSTNTPEDLNATCLELRQPHHVEIEQPDVPTLELRLH